MNPGNVAGPLFLVLGALILRRRAGHAMGRLYLLVGGLLTVFAFANSGLFAGFPRGIQLVLGWYSSWAWVVPVVLVGTFGILLLPDGRLPGPRWRWVGYGSVLAMLGFVVAMPYDDSVSAELREAMPAWGMPLAEPAFLVAAVLAVTMMPVSLAAPVVRMWRGGPPVRRQLGPVAVACAAALVLVGLQDPVVRFLPVTHDMVLAVALGLLPVGVTVAVVRGGLFDINRLVSRVVTYGIVLTVVVGCYLALVLVLSTLARGVTGDDGDIVVAMSTLTVAALFQPLRRRVRDLVDRRFDRSRHDASRTIDEFGHGLRDSVALEGVVEQLGAVVRGTFRPSFVTVHLIGREASP